MKKTMLLTTVLVAGSFAIAEDTLEFTAVDTDSNGLITMAEAVVDEALLDSFTSLDLDHDGKLTEEEFAAYTTMQSQQEG